MLTLEESKMLILRSEVRTPVSDDEKFVDNDPVPLRNNCGGNFDWLLDSIRKVKIDLDALPT